MLGDNLMLACVAQGAIAGLIELKEGCHVAMLFIAPGWHRQGIGTRLMNAALEHARVDVVTVKASLSSVPAFQRYGRNGRVCRDGLPANGKTPADSVGAALSRTWRKAVPGFQLRS